LTSSEPLSHEEWLTELTTRLNVLEEIVRQRDKIIANAVIETLRSEEVIGEYLLRLTEKVEAEFTGAFLPELRQLLLSRLERVERQLAGGGETNEPE